MPPAFPCEPLTKHGNEQQFFFDLFNVKEDMIANGRDRNHLWTSFREDFIVWLTYLRYTAIWKLMMITLINSVLDDKNTIPAKPNSSSVYFIGYIKCSTALESP